MNPISQGIKSILCIRDGAHGDVLLTTPAVAALRAKYPHAEIVYLTNVSDGDVLAGFSAINRLVFFKDKQAPRTFDLVIDWRDRSGPIPFKYKKLIRAIDLPHMRTDLNSRIARSRMGVPFARQYAEIAGVEIPGDARPIIRCDAYPIPDAPYVVVSFDSWWKSKAYPFGMANELCRKLTEHYSVVVLGKQNPWSKIVGPNIINLINKTTVQQAATVISKSVLFIGIDSLPIHLAQAVGKQSVSIWTATEPRSILSLPGLDHPVESEAKCHPCFCTECRQKQGCFPEPERIYQEAMKVLKNETRPVTWIAMPTMGQVELTTQAIKGLFERKNDLPFHLILIDNGSSPEDAQTLRELSKKYNFTLIRNEENLGFVAATNAGIRYALEHSSNIDHDYALWLNNDVTIDADGWLDLLVKASGNAAVVGPEGSRLKDDFSHAGWVKVGGREPHYVDGWCLFAPLRYYRDQVGLLDFNINIFSEDADWCLRAKSAGCEIKLAKIPITHLKHKSYKLFPHHERCQESLRYMQEKYGTLANALKPAPKAVFVPAPKVAVQVITTERLQVPCICGNKEDTVLGMVDGFPIVRCMCGIQRTAEMLNPEALAAHYDKSLALRMTPQWMQNVQKTQEGYWGECDRYDIGVMQRHGRFLDVGCNLGVMVERAKRFGWDAMGSDFAPAFVEKCREKGLNVVLGSGLNGQIQGPVQVITMFDVIEHDPRPLDTLKRAYELLDPKGFLALTTPDHGCAIARKLGLKYEHIRPIEHIWHFTTATITRLLEQAGFAVDEVRHADKHVDYKGNRLFFCRKVV